MKQDQIKWILNDSVCVVDGWCWTITPRGGTVCIGKEEDVINKKGDIVGIVEEG